MRILNEKPPMLDEIFGAGMSPNLDNTIFTYGETIYNPSGREIADHLIEHESVHTEQQDDDPDSWWERYLRDAYFRLNQEAEAYGRQFAFICGQVKDRNRRNRILMDLAGSLSSPTYGSMVTQQGAMKMIKERAGVRP